MKKLIRIPTKYWIVIGITFFVCITFIIFLLSYKVESVIHTKVHVKGSTSSVYVNSDAAYRIKDQNIINLKIDSKIYTGVIKNIIYDDSLKLYKVEIVGLNIQLLPNSILDATIITGTHSVGSFLISSI